MKNCIYYKKVNEFVMLTDRTHRCTHPKHPLKGKDSKVQDAAVLHFAKDKVASICLKGGHDCSIASISLDGTKKCPYCAEKILAEAKLCKHCRSTLD
ncbi:hypothetical protein ACFLFF_09575 [Brevibacillus reuszeri]|uniref:hypothetical protein n=1 Tax=Brevibacillus reuszeri TaxID=54915 RepID=UPI00366FC817